jgi:hypothetical protein
MRIAAGPRAAKAGSPEMSEKAAKIDPKWLRIGHCSSFLRGFPNVFTPAPRNQQFETAIPA